MHARDNFHRLTKRDTGLPGSTDYLYLTVHLSNVGYIAPTESNLEDVDRACETAVKAVEDYRRGCRSMLRSIRHSGGEEAYRVEIVRRAVKDMVDMAPVALAEQKVSKPDPKAMIARYLMEHAEDVSFEELFDDRPPCLKTPGENDRFMERVFDDPLDNHCKRVVKDEDEKTD